MKKHKYSSKTMPQGWKKKKSTSLKQIKMKQKKEDPSMQKSNFKKFALLKHKKPKYFKKTTSKWKLPAAITLSTLLMLILVIPTLIVIPFGTDNQTEANIVENDPEQQEEVVESPFSVAVMRDISQTVEDVPLEDYIAGVVASEMPLEFEIEALKAQALAARTYVVDHILYSDTDDFDVTDTVQHQVYKDETELKEIYGDEYNELMKKAKEAVAATEGEILTHSDAPITPAYFSTSNGFTENSEEYWEDELPYLRSVESPWDEESPKFLDQEIFSIDEIENELQIDLPNNDAVAIEITRTESERVSDMGIDGNHFSGREIREQFELQSSDFTVEQKDDHLIFTTKGYGHGIGMSQYGANGMAEEGEDYLDIVNYYYKDVEISTVDDTAPTLVAS
ncbi:stage II sporulation protein D [Virgibacillus natechei]|uniref:Stage II sporulation protein D n=1 Tax=Virgibacillus natechei TaxID=1216297 RepID=A0ABS4IL45_9BACI|nr:stage II sporulation protein D [Virgibacillus natechei]MBP1971688.1 stage II sporulation protein D [Virgibacillus natechei]UZD12577.1 stage II sporulation protein D [Virgibacillus natechei]